MPTVLIIDDEAANRELLGKSSKRRVTPSFPPMTATTVLRVFAMSGRTPFCLTSICPA